MADARLCTTSWHMHRNPENSVQGFKHRLLRWAPCLNSSSPTSHLYLDRLQMPLGPPGPWVESRYRTSETPGAVRSQEGSPSSRWHKGGDPVAQHQGNTVSREHSWQWRLVKNLTLKIERGYLFLSMAGELVVERHKNTFEPTPSAVSSTSVQL